MSRQAVLTAGGFHAYGHRMQDHDSQGHGFVGEGSQSHYDEGRLPAHMELMYPPHPHNHHTHNHHHHNHNHHPELVPVYHQLLPHQPLQQQPQTQLHKQQQQQHLEQQRRRHHQQQQLQQLQQHPGHIGPRPTAVRMVAADSAYVLPDDELAQLQKLSGDYQPETTGPLVGERQSSAAITAEYANADPVYRAKTAVLPDKYAYFRTCLGDGHCGWRAVAFTYFECLIREANVAKFDTELARLMSLENIFHLTSIPYDMILDFAEDAFDLLRKLADALTTGDANADDLLLQAFNQDNISMAIITYIKFLTSAWVQTHPDDFVGFVTMGDLKTYCSLNIEPSQCEIDYVAVAALTAALIKPAGFGFEIMYLDRSPGEEANVTPFSQPTEQGGLLLPTIRLLYRPGHYDILYKAEDFPVPVQQVPEQAPLRVALANPYHDSFVAAPSNVDLMAMIPGLYPTGLGQRWPSVSYDFDSSPAPQTSQVTTIQPYPSAPEIVAPTPTSHQDFIPVDTSPVVQQAPPSHHPIQLEAPPITLPIQPPPPSASLDRAPLTLERGGPFRPSMYELEHLHALPLQTAIFKNSHYNTAHFMNPDFQPEAWSPEYSSKGKNKSPSQ
ncbi:unnamed protein product [Periconia digitata]|uniref:ubiquitinyl hydrolase 1 n=1 Tax=Periconia digitata TaxID=1303443 RepID=A0A9W4XLG6_9PLEO|nr:unnamed protein product [Periconia digitata]